MKENAVISCLFYPSISSVIGKVQCLRQKRVKRWRYQGGYKERAICVPSRQCKLCHNAININYVFVLVYVQNCKRAQSLSHLSWSFVKEFAVSSYSWSYAQLCMLTQDKSTKLWELHYTPGENCGWLGQKSQPNKKCFSIRIHFTPLNQ